MSRAPPPDIGAVPEVEVSFATPGFAFTATAEPTGKKCGRSQTVALDPTGPTTHRLRPIGPRGDYVISLFGRGTDPSGPTGDISASFRWRTLAEGPNEQPHASTSILAGTPESPTSYGVELSINDLRSTPRMDRASASVVVTGATGASARIGLGRKPVECSAEGSVVFSASEETGLRAASVGPAPFRYEVTVVIDRITYRASATWPVDEDPSCTCIPLVFQSALPGL